MLKGRPKKTSTDPTLSELGITRDQSATWQKLAEIPEEEFERAISEAMAKPADEPQGKLTTRGILRAAGRTKGRTASLGKKAWLVTWEWSGDHARVEDRIVAVFGPRLSGERVRELVDCIHSVLKYTPRERMAWTFNPKANPYPAQFGEVYGGGVRWTGEVTCGDNPWLRARLVDDLVIDEDHPQGAWKERPRPHRKPGF